MLVSCVQDLTRHVLFGDNLKSQTSDPFKETFSQKSGEVQLGLPDGTDLWQHNDAGYAQIIKVCASFLNVRIVFLMFPGLDLYNFFIFIKGALSGLRQFLATENPLKMMKNTFYFTLKVVSATFLLDCF